MTRSVVSSVRLSLDLDAALAGIAESRAPLLLGLLFVGLAEVADELGINLAVVAPDVAQVLKYRLPDPLEARLEALRAQLGGPPPRGRTARASAAAPPTDEAARAPAPEVTPPPAPGPPPADWAALGSEGDDY